MDLSPAGSANGDDPRMRDSPSQQVLHRSAQTSPWPGMAGDLCVLLLNNIQKNGLWTSEVGEEFPPVGQSAPQSTQWPNRTLGTRARQARWRACGMGASITKTDGFYLRIADSMNG